MTAVLCLDGDDVEGHHEVVSALARVIADTADSAILDAFLTKQAVVADTIIYTGSRADDLPSTRRLVVESMVGTRPNRARDASERLEADVEAKTFRRRRPRQPRGHRPALARRGVAARRPAPRAQAPARGDRARRRPRAAPAPTSGRPSTPGSGRGAPRGSPVSRSRSANSPYRPGETAPDWTTTPMPRR